MEEKVAAALSGYLVETLTVLVPLAVSGMCAWVSSKVRSNGAAMKVIDVVGGNVGRAANDPGKQ